MAEPFKNLINAGTVRAAARHLQRAWPAFDAARFAALALQGLDALEMKARAMQICAALEATLPADFDAAAALIEAALAPPGDGEDLSTLRSRPTAWPAGCCGRWASSSRAAAWTRRSARCAAARADAALHGRVRDPAVHRAPPGARLRHAAALDRRPERRTCAAWSAKAAARACPGACS